MENAGSSTVSLPSLTVMTMLLYVPTSVPDGRPVKRPVCVSNVAHDGRLRILKLSASPSASLAHGWYWYGTPAVAVAGGRPEMTGGVLFSRSHREAAAAGF